MAEKKSEAPPPTATFTKEQYEKAIADSTLDSQIYIEGDKITIRPDLVILLSKESKK